jgi:hypothetical protein
MRSFKAWELTYINIIVAMSHDKCQISWKILRFRSPFDETQTCNRGARSSREMVCRADDGSNNWLKVEHRVVSIPQYQTSGEHVDVIFGQSRVPRAVGVEANVQSGVALEC